VFSRAAECPSAVQCSDRQCQRVMIDRLQNALRKLHSTDHRRYDLLTEPNDQYVWCALMSAEYLPLPSVLRNVQGSMSQV
jgi:hypothetical protein